MTLAPAPDTPRVGMSMDDFLRRSAEAGEFEILGEEIVHRMSTTSTHSKVIKRLLRLFLPFEDRNLGEVFSETTFVLEDTPDWVRGSRIPDLMWIGQEKLESFYALVPQATRKPFVLLPDIVVEVVSPNDKYSDITSKVDLYLRDGVKLIWVVDFDAQTVVVHAAGQSPTVLRGAQLLTGGDILPDFSTPIADLFTPSA